MPTGPPTTSPASLLPSLHTRYPLQLHGFAIPTTDFFQFNTSIPPFDDVRARRAFNFAINRNAIAKIYGGSERATPTCQVLPPGTSGYRRYCPYTLHPDPSGRWTAPDIRQARHLVEVSGTRGMKVTVWGWTDDPTLNPQVVRYAAGVLRQIGYRTTIRLIPHAYLAHPPNMSVFDPIQLIPGAWGDTPYGFFSTWFSCNGIGSHHWFCDPSVDRAIGRARALKTRSPAAAAAAFAGIDRQLVDLAAWAPIVDERGIDFVSARIHNYQSHPYWGIMADQLGPLTPAPCRTDPPNQPSRKLEGCTTERFPVPWMRNLLAAPDLGAVAEREPCGFDEAAEQARNSLTERFTKPRAWRSRSASGGEGAPHCPPRSTSDLL